MKVSARWTEAAVCRTASAILVHPLARQPSIKALRMAASTCGVLLRDDEPPHILALREELAVLLDRRLAQRHPVRAQQERRKDEG
jgi:hypothetical protein